MKLLKKILMSTPVLLVIFLALVILGIAILFTGVVAVSYYTDITISVVFVSAIFFALWKHRRVRRPPFSEQFYSSEIGKKNSQRHWNLWREESKLLLVSGLLLSTISVTNYWYGFTTAPLVLLGYGTFFIVIFYLINKGPIDISELRDATYKLDNKLDAPTFFQTTLNYFIILILISGFWFYQINKNLATQREAGYEAALDLIDYKYCSNNLNVCGAVDAISSVSFKMERVDSRPGKGLRMCVWLNFKYSLQDGKYDSDYRIEEICFNPSRYGGYWSEFELGDTVADVLKQKIG